jgi:hypothetical protein
MNWVSFGRCFNVEKTNIPVYLQKELRCRRGKKVVEQLSAAISDCN